MRAALSRQDLLGSVLAGSSWAAWRILLIAAMGESLTADERAIFSRFTGRQTEPLERVEELWAIVGRRGGKSRAAAVLSVYLACLCDHSANLSAGERGLVLYLAQNSKAAQVAFSYAEAVFAGVPALVGEIINRTADTLSLRNRIDLEIRPASYRGLRGMTSVAIVADECSVWYSEETGSSNADTAILNSVRPTLATTGGPLIVISSPYAKRGEVYRAFREHYGPQGDPRILVAHGTSRDFNPALPQRVIDRALARDAAAASAEYLAQFRSDLEAFVSREVVDAAVVPDRHELLPVSGTVYEAFVDPSGGSADSMTLAIAHRDLKTSCGVVDAVWEVRPSFSPETVVEEFSALLKSYGVHSVTGDRYAGEWPRERFRVHGIAYEPSEKPKSVIYGELLPILNSGGCELLDLSRLTSQLCGLERRTARGGRDSIDHPPGAHDDLANCVAGALVRVVGQADLITWKKISELAGDLPPGPGWPCSPMGMPLSG
jgi:hypothetical protein